MASVTPVTTKAPGESSNLTHHTKWEGLSEVDTEGLPVSREQTGHSDRSVHVFGTFNGNTVTIEGSNEIVPSVSNWITIEDAFGNPMTFTSNGGQAVSANFLHYRPTSIGGTGVDVDVVLLSRRTS